MAEKEIKITFPEVKMEALEFFLREQNTTVEKVLKVKVVSKKIINLLSGEWVDIP